MRILVTGANGFIGRGVTTQLLDRGHEVVAAVITDDPVDPRVKAVNVNIFDIDDLSARFGQLDCVIHLAWEDGFIHNSNKHIKQLPAHCDFVSHCITARIPRLIILGTMHEVGYHEGSIHAWTPCRPQSNYGIAKNALRDYAFKEAAANNTVLQWLRGFYIVDNSPKGSSIFSKIVRAEVNGDKTFPFTSGKPLYDFIDYDDFTSLVADFVTAEPTSGIYNVASGEPESLASRVERFIRDNGFRIKLAYGAYPDRPYDSPAIWADMANTYRVLGGA